MWFARRAIQLLWTPTIAKLGLLTSVSAAMKSTLLASYAMQSAVITCP